MVKIDKNIERQILDEEAALSTIKYIMDKEEALEFLALLDPDTIYALDLETTGLNPLINKVRLSCIYHPSIGIVLLDHFFCGSFADLAKEMLGPMWAVYNSKFEVRWFDQYEPNQVDLIDVDFLAKSHRGGYPSSLAMMCKRDLGVILDKEEQLSDWSQEKLTNSQLRYAGRDAYYTYLLYEHWITKLSTEGRDGAFVFQDAVRATVECEEVGMVLDTEYHKKNIAMWEKKQTIAYKRMRHWTNSNALPNPGSDTQVAALLEKQLSPNLKAVWPRTKTKGQLMLGRKEIMPIVAKSPYPFSRWMNALIRYRYYRKYLTTYGETLITKQYLEDAITYRLNIGQAATGRYSSSSINIQNIPRNPGVRKAFKPPHGYEYLVVADYSGVEIRVLAELSQDKQLLQDAIYGDVHSSSASAIYHVDLDTILEVIHEEVDESKGEQHSAEYFRYKEYRSKAKGFTFQLTYGAAAFALSVVLKCSVDEAEEAIRKWAARYPKAYNYRHLMLDAMMQTGYLPIVDGRQVFVFKQDRRLPVAANYPIQGAAASVMYRAMHHVYEMRNAISSKSRIPMVATVHDELLLACNEPDLETAHKVLTEGMQQGWLDVFPNTDTHNLIESKHGHSWGEAK